MRSFKPSPIFAEACFISVSMALLSYSLAIGGALIFYGQLGDGATAISLCVIISLFTAVFYHRTEVHYNKTDIPPLTVALSYFITFAVISAFVFSFLTTYDFSRLYNEWANEAKNVYFICSFIITLANVLMLSVRIASDFIVFSKAIRK